MVYVLSVLSAVIFVECFLRLPFWAMLTRFYKIMMQSLWVISAKSVSDHWKEKVMPVYSAQICILTFKIVFLLAVVVFCAILPVAVYSQISAGDFSVVGSVSVDLVFIAISTVVGMAYSFVRVKYV